MRIVTFRKIQEFSEQHPEVKSALQDWYHKTSRAKWYSLSDMKNTFGTSDYAGNNRFVFNIKENHYRLVAIVIFASQKVYIRFLGTHAEYEKINCSSI